jgi:hypothetical protein
MQKPLKAKDNQRLKVVAGMMIPRGEEYLTPSADDPAILQDILVTVQMHVGQLVGALNTLDGLCEARYKKGLTELDDSEKTDMLPIFSACRDADVCVLVRIVLLCYYRDDRVLSALGQPVRAPFPQGYVVEQGDWSLLDPVKRRSKFYRAV